MKKQILCFLLFIPFLLSLPAQAAGDSEPVGYCQSLLQAMSDPPATVAETPLGSVTADAVRVAAGSDLAVVTADEFYANIQPGDVTAEDIAAALPYNQPYVLISVTVQELVALLEKTYANIRLTEEYSIDKEQSASGDFLQISGFSVHYDPNLPVGQRVRKLWIANVEQDLSDTRQQFILAMPAHQYDSTVFSSSPVSSDITAAGALIDYFILQDSVALPPDGRIHPIAVRDNDLINNYPVILIAFCIIVIVVCGKFLLKMAATNRQ